VSRIVLASQSPRRRALLAALGLDFDVIVSDAPEVDHGDDPAAVVCANARAKAAAVASRLHGDKLVIAADTLVFLDRVPLSKPADLDEARAMLRRLSGRTHEVVTGIALIDAASGRHAEDSETTRVTFRELSDDEINAFVLAVRPTDRAGAYTVDGPGSLLIARYEGCYQNVLGLPLVRLDTMLRAFGHSLFERMDAAKAVFL